MEGYSRLLGWEVYNFESIEHGKCEFDERNIINLKGYNDSGKSAMITALRVLFTNYKPTSHLSFIRDDSDYFRIVAYFDDGIIIVRDKYLNGQSLYEMYKGDDLLYTTKTKTGALTKVNEVPEPIRNYLGLIDNDGSSINFRTRDEKMVGVQTSGSENYKMFNNVLKSEELASASAMLNNDKNKLLADISSIDSQINATKAILGTSEGITREMVDALKELDSSVDIVTALSEKANSVSDLSSEINSLHILPEIGVIGDVSVLALIEDIHYEMASVIVTPELAELEGIELLSRIEELSATSFEIQPELPILDEVSTLGEIASLKEEYDSLSIEALDSEIESINQQIEQLTKESGVETRRCPNCGEVIVI